MSGAHMKTYLSGAFGRRWFPAAEVRGNYTERCVGAEIA